MKSKLWFSLEKFYVPLDVHIWKLATVQDYQFEWSERKLPCNLVSYPEQVKSPG